MNWYQLFPGNPDLYVLPAKLLADSLAYVGETLTWSEADLLAYMQEWAHEHSHASQWTSRSNNAKTGSVPTQWVGADRESSLESCEGCSLRDGFTDPETGTLSKCYAHFGTPALAHSSVRRAWKRRPERYSPLYAVNEAPRSAKSIRLAGIGDSARAYRLHLYAALYLAYLRGLQTLAYTHMWRHAWAQDLRPWFMASCQTWEEVALAKSMGWRATIVQSVGPESWSNGQYVGSRKLGSGVVCPAMVSHGKVQCADCRLCNGQIAGPVIVFPEHGPGSNSRKNRAKAEDRRISYE